jgi:hypothetical protein
MWNIITQGLALAQALLPSDQAWKGDSLDGGYAGPYTTGEAWATAYEHAVSLVSQMTVEEKVGAFIGATKHLLSWAAKLTTGQSYHCNHRTMSGKLGGCTSTWTTGSLLQ